MKKRDGQGPSAGGAREREDRAVRAHLDVDGESRHAREHDGAVEEPDRAVDLLVAVAPDLHGDHAGDRPEDRREDHQDVGQQGRAAQDEQGGLRRLGESRQREHRASFARTRIRVFLARVNGAAEEVVHPFCIAREGDLWDDFSV